MAGSVWMLLHQRQIEMVCLPGTQANHLLNLPEMRCDRAKNICTFDSVDCYATVAHPATVR